MATAGQPEPTHVVTCFLLRSQAGWDEVLLVRRSERVRTYRGAWAGISGYVEPGVAPLEQAYTELSEEVALSRADVRLLRVGAEVAFDDLALGQAWVVHPFLFALADSASPRTDWEATEHRWLPPAEVRTLSTVPHLTEALAAVYPPREEHHVAP
ncbi:MAG: NUDIX pyrophosphatase [Ktedonobacterales bacterium]|nr:NUDIX pyrophosphatase [Ktedonobacterales bacterium]